MNDIIAATFITRSLKEKKDIPEDFSVSGFDGASVTQLLPVKLQTVSLEVEEIGRIAGEWVNTRVIEKSPKPYQVRLAGKMIKGESI